MTIEERRISRAQRRKKSSFLIKFIMGIGACLFLLLVSATVFYWLAGGSFGSLRSNITAVTSNNGEYDNVSYPNKVNILVLGVDERPTGDDPGRSDTMFVLTIDTKSEQVSLLSVPRDTRTYVKGLGWDKINHAYSYGGVKLAKEAAAGLLGISLDYYACINFDGFYKIIDSLGGVTIDVEKRMYYEDPYDDLVIDLRPGVQKLSGQKAIHYVRYRDEEGDLGRIKRQQKFIAALTQETVSPFILTRLPAIVSDISASIKTDMTISEMVGLAKILRKASQNGLRAETVTGTPVFIDEVDYWLPNITELRKYLAQTQGAQNSANWEAATKVQSNRYYTSIPSRAEFDEVPYWLENYVTASSDYSSSDSNIDSDFKEVAVKTEKDDEDNLNRVTTVTKKSNTAQKPEQTKPVNKTKPVETPKPNRPNVSQTPSPAPTTDKRTEIKPVVKPKPVEKKSIETRIPTETPKEPEAKKPAA